MKTLLFLREKYGKYLDQENNFIEIINSLSITEIEKRKELVRKKISNLYGYLRLEEELVELLAILPEYCFKIVYFIEVKFSDTVTSQCPIFGQIVNYISTGGVTDTSYIEWGHRILADNHGELVKGFIPISKHDSEDYIFGFDIHHKQYCLFDLDDGMFYYLGSNFKDLIASLKLEKYGL